MTEGKAWHRQDWHRLTIAEKHAEQRRRHDEKFLVREYRCRRCIVVVDGASRAGHAVRCLGLTARPADADLEAMYSVVEAKGEGWRVDAALATAVQLRVGGAMAPDAHTNGNGKAPLIDRELAAKKRDYALNWARGEFTTGGEPPTAVALIAEVRSKFDSGFSNRVAAKILADACSTALPPPGETFVVTVPPTPERVELAPDVFAALPGAAPGVVGPNGHHAAPVGVGPVLAAAGASCAAISAAVVGAVLGAVAALRSIGAQSFTVDGQVFAVS